MKMKFASYLSAFLVFFCFASLSAQQAGAVGVFNQVRFVEPGNLALGLEPEVSLGDSAGAGINFHYTQGMNDLVNLKAILGTGTETRAFRMGLSGIFDVFPDSHGQPGIGIAVNALYSRASSHGMTEFTLSPYIHKSFTSGKSDFEPFISLPFGVMSHRGVSRGITTLSLGSIFKQWEKTRFILEVGVAINNSNSYVSGGFVYYP